MGRIVLAMIPEKAGPYDTPEGQSRRKVGRAPKMLPPPLVDHRIRILA
jgi:hypothetical protein